MSTTTINLDQKTYGKLLGRTRPHVIHTEEECERLTNELMRLDERENLVTLFVGAEIRAIG